MKKVRVYLTGDTSADFSRAITQATTSHYSHALISFRDSADDLPEVYFESIWKKREGMESPGVRGPVPIERLYDWYQENPVDRRVHSFDLLLRPGEAQDAFDYAMQASGTIAYAPLQVARLLMTLGLPLVVGPRVASVDHQTCSEFVARCLPPWLQVQYLQIGQFTYDYVIPAGGDGRLPSLYRGLLRLAEIHGSDWRRFPVGHSAPPAPDSFDEMIEKGEVDDARR